MNHDIDPAQTLNDEAFIPLEHSGDVSCFACGLKVNVLKAMTFECNVGPTAFLHHECFNKHAGRDQALWELYEMRVLGTAANLFPKVFHQ